MSWQHFNRETAEVTTQAKEGRLDCEGIVGLAVAASVINRDD